MLTMTWKDLLVEEQRRKDMLERSQKAKMGLMMVKLLEPEEVKDRVADRWLYALGAYLVRWGRRLQSRRTAALKAMQIASMNGSTAAGNC